MIIDLQYVFLMRGDNNKYRCEPCFKLIAEINFAGRNGVDRFQMWIDYEWLR